MRNIKYLVLVSLMLLLLAACQNASPAQTIEIKDAWIRAATGVNGEAPSNSSGEMNQMGNEMGFNTAAYLVIVNRGKSAERLLRVKSDIAQEIELHESQMQGGVMSMKPVNFIEIPAGGQVELKPGGLHIMFINLKQDLMPGNTVQLGLVFENAGEISVTAEVRSP